MDTTPSLAAGQTAAVAPEAVGGRMCPYGPELIAKMGYDMSRVFSGYMRPITFERKYGLHWKRAWRIVARHINGTAGCQEARP